jgi:hypothetical protein
MALFPLAKVLFRMMEEVVFTPVKATLSQFVLILQGM